ncbi:MAG: SDR family oxidoreductase [Methanobacteriota archaeon]|nr:MAG: SDR family oxidoreductase [Euryarchaeota archaeon]
MRWVVTGGAGFIGSHIVEALAARGDEVVVVDDLFSGNVDNIRPFMGDGSVEFVRGSILDRPLMNSACSGADGIFHQAAIASVPRSVKDPLATHEANATGSLCVLLAARDAGVGKVVQASSSSVYGDTPVLPKHEGMAPSPLSPYAASKLVAEEYASCFASLYGLPTVSLRYFNVFGPRQDPKSDYAAVIPRFVSHCLRGDPPVIFGDGLQTRDFTFVKDVVAANLLAMDADATGVFNIAGGKRISVNDLAQAVMDATGVPGSPLYEPPRAGDIKDSLADISRAKSAFGFTPAYTLADGLAASIAWYREALAPR